jgi:hypothetical protein
MALWGKTDTQAAAPKYLSTEEAAKVYFIDTTEAGIAANRAKGIQTPGWNLYSTYTAAGGATRHKVETLVAMKVSAANAGDVGAIVIAATAMANNTVYTIRTAGDTDFTLVGAANSDVGTTFTSDISGGAATGTGTVARSDDPVAADS